MSSPDPDREPIEVLVEEFAERCRAGKNPSISEYVERYPELADDIRDLFPSVAMIEQVKQDDESDPTVATVPAGPMGAQPLEKLGDFRIVREIGRGGMGIVYEAEQQSLGRRVALKVLPAGSLVSAQQVRRFQREAQAAARLHHTNIVPVFGVGEQDGMHYYVMQLIEGQGLDQAFSGSTRGADECWSTIARIGCQVAHALDHAHALGVLHRDVKPANLIMEPAGTVWVADFGLARLEEQEGLTRSGDVIGTIRYMAPEQFKGESDARSDIYSLGLTLYELLTLRPAYDESDRGQLIRQVMHEEVPAPRGVNAAIPADLETIVMKCTAREPGRRYQTAAELGDDLQRYLDGRPIRARQITQLGRLGLWCRRDPALASASFAALALLVAAAAIGWTGYVRTSQALERESRQLQATEAARMRTEAARKRTEAERRRAQANLELATQAFGEVFDQISIGPLGAPTMGSKEGQPAFLPAVSTRDAAILQNLLKFYGRFAEENR